MPKVITKETPEPATTPQPEPEDKETVDLEYDHDAESNTVSFTLSNGTEITVREPKAIDFLRVKGWRDAADSDDQSPQMAGYKMVSLCVTRFKRISDQKPKLKISVYELIDQFETQSDMLMAANCLDFFRNTISRLSGESNIRLQQSTVHPEDAS